jgi:hypothetical protein
MRLDSCLRFSASLYPRFQSAVFEDNAEVELFRLLAKSGEVARQVGVFGGEDWFASLDAGQLVAAWDGCHP